MRRFNVCLGRVAEDGWREVGSMSDEKGEALEQSRVPASSSLAERNRNPGKLAQTGQRAASSST